LTRAGLLMEVARHPPGTSVLSRPGGLHFSANAVFLAL
jgi:hypothetical protein